MGHYTYYSLSLTIDDEKQNAVDIIKHLREEYTEAESAIEENGTTRDEAKWYDFDRDMDEFSRKYPDVLFVLSGEPCVPDSKNDRSWVLTYKNGGSRTRYQEIQEKKSIKKGLKVWWLP